MQDTALNQALGQLRPTLLKIARLQLRNDTWAEDVVSETLIAALEGVRDFAGTSQLKTWVVGILKHKIIDQFRRTSREVSVEAAVEAAEAESYEELFQANRLRQARLARGSGAGRAGWAREGRAAHDVGGQLAPEGRDLDVVLLEDRLARLVLDLRRAQLPGDLVIGVDPRARPAPWRGRNRGP